MTPSLSSPLSRLNALLQSHCLDQVESEICKIEEFSPDKGELVTAIFSYMERHPAHVSLAWHESLAILKKLEQKDPGHKGLREMAKQILLKQQKEDASSKTRLPTPAPAFSSLARAQRAPLPIVSSNPLREVEKKPIGSKELFYLQQTVGNPLNIELESLKQLFNLKSLSTKLPTLYQAAREKWQQYVETLSKLSSIQKELTQLKEKATEGVKLPKIVTYSVLPVIAVALLCTIPIVGPVIAMASLGLGALLLAAFVFGGPLLFFMNFGSAKVKVQLEAEITILEKQAQQVCQELDTALPLLSEVCEKEGELWIEALEEEIKDHHQASREPHKTSEEREFHQQQATLSLSTQKQLSSLFCTLGAAPLNN